jgi:hypothetical protein
LNQVCPSTTGSSACACATGFKFCNTTCIASAGCCKDADCTNVATPHCNTTSHTCY